MYSSVSGDWNTAIGFGAAANSTAGVGNTANGAWALNNSTGDFNIAVGFQAEMFGNHTNSISIGYNSTALGDYKVSIGNANIVSNGGYQLWSNLSDGRFKENVVEDVPGLAFIEQLRPVTYTFNCSEYNNHIGLSIENDTMIDEAAKQAWKEQEEKQEQVVHTGFIAQEVEVVAKKIGYSFNGVVTPQSDKDHYSLRYASFVVPLVKATQEQQQEIKALNNKIAAQDQEIAELKRLVVGLIDDKTSTVREIDGAISPVICYPNPSKGIINLSIQNLQKETIEVSVFNVAGRLVYSANSDDANFAKEIDLTDQANGMYTVHTQIGQTSYQNKVLVQ